MPQKPPLDARTRRTINEEAVKQFLSTWDPAWRWMLVLGIRDMRANLSHLGELALAETGLNEWTHEGYVYGPLALGLTAAAVNEAAQHSEDLFALLKFLPESTEFAKRMMSYSAGQVTALGRSLPECSNDAIRALFFVPDRRVILDGLCKATDPQASVQKVEQGIERLLALTREVADWYLSYEFFHLQYKHGLKLPLRRPFGGELPGSTIDKRKQNVEAPLLAYTNETLSASLARPPEQQGLMMPGSPTSAPHLVQLINERALLRFQMAGQPIDLDDVVALCWSIVRLQRIAAANRIAVSDGLNDDSQQGFQLPAEDPYEVINVTLELARPATLADFA
jgi:hypothetical protein